MGFCHFGTKTKAPFLYLETDLVKNQYFILKITTVYTLASEIKAIQSLISKKLKIDYDYLKEYIIYGYKFLHMDNRTFFHQIFRMESATNMIISEDGIKDNQILGTKSRTKLFLILQRCFRWCKETFV